LVNCFDWELYDQWNRATKETAERERQRRRGGGDYGDAA